MEMGAGGGSRAVLSAVLGAGRGALTSDHGFRGVDVYNLVKLQAEHEFPAKKTYEL